MPTLLLVQNGIYTFLPVSKEPYFLYLYTRICTLLLKMNIVYAHAPKHKTFKQKQNRYRCFVCTLSSTKNNFKPLDYESNSSLVCCHRQLLDDWQGLNGGRLVCILCTSTPLRQEKNDLYRRKTPYLPHLYISETIVEYFTRKCNFSSSCNMKHFDEEYSKV